MITMKPILEQAVLALLADGRFSPLPEGYIMTDGGRYLGYCLFGIWGMLLLPVLLLFVKQLLDSGAIHLWK